MSEKPIKSQLEYQLAVEAVEAVDRCIGNLVERESLVLEIERVMRFEFEQEIVGTERLSSRLAQQKAKLARRTALIRTYTETMMGFWQYSTIYANKNAIGLSASAISLKVAMRTIG